MTDFMSLWDDGLMAVDDARHNEIGEFLKARRVEIRPEDVGLPAAANSRRRARGLRREEVAALAAISTDYYSRIEQGRRFAPWSTLDAIARVLHIDQAGRDYLMELSTTEPTKPRRRTTRPVSAHLRRLVSDLATTPALVLGRRMDILAWNPAAEALLLTDFATLPEQERNYAHLVFTQHRVRALYVDWESTGRLCVYQLHMEVARDPHDKRLAALVGELSVRDVDFRRWWGKHQVASRNRGVKKFNHPEVGELTLDWDTLTCADDPDHRLITWNAETGTDSHERLLALRSRSKSGSAS